MTNDRQLPLFPTLEHSPHARARAISSERAACGVYQNLTAPAEGPPRAGDLLSDLDDLTEADLAILQFMRHLDCAEGLREDLVEKRRKARIYDARKAEEAIAKAEADRVAAEEEAVRQAAWAEYRAFKEDALAYLYE
ncbi:hypothetical protein [Aurantimonas coralicida]|uniref:hypothetical protein n=1 Tax=Aurantimonas coralicida TaxID=182270 RepID=UPI001D17E0C1|nr:hypothetical protein [Aurantimonas coralicida]MCC4298425.1 hypothetical protein [Aurantimonas coralicida]